MHSDPWELSRILSSNARFRVLQVLVPLPEGMGLRELERATHLNIRSVQLATQGLVRERILKKDRRGHFRLNSRLPIAVKIKKLFIFLRDEQIRERAQKFSTRAKQVIQLSEEMIQFTRTPIPTLKEKP